MLKSARLNDYTVAVGFGSKAADDDIDEDEDSEDLDDFLND
jgi:hypothetical protein